MTHSIRFCNRLIFSETRNENSKTRSDDGEHASSHATRADGSTREPCGRSLDHDQWGGGSHRDHHYERDG